MSNDILLCCYNLSKSYLDGSFNIKVINNINFCLNLGEMVSIVGSSGSGKTTLLNLLAGLDYPDNGDVIFEGKSLYKLSDKDLALVRNRRLGFIYQFHYLLSNFNVLDNVAIPLMIGGVQKKKARNRAKLILSKVNLDHRFYHFPSELSGGERQRVAVARAIINCPALVLADEPTGNLDNKNTENIFRLLKKFNTYYGISFLIATHDLEIANSMHRKIIMRDGILT